jgi:hypothetical protein
MLNIVRLRLAYSLDHPCVNSEHVPGGESRVFGRSLRSNPPRLRVPAFDARGTHLALRETAVSTGGKVQSDL